MPSAHWGEYGLNLNLKPEPVNGVTVKNASEGDLVSCVLYTKAVAHLSLH